MNFVDKVQKQIVSKRKPKNKKITLSTQYGEIIFEFKIVNYLDGKFKYGTAQ
jgi:hypothetical protein